MGQPTAPESLAPSERAIKRGRMSAVAISPRPTWEQALAGWAMMATTWSPGVIVRVKVLWQSAGLGMTELRAELLNLILNFKTNIPGRQQEKRENMTFKTLALTSLDIPCFWGICMEVVIRKRRCTATVLRARPRKEASTRMI